MQSKRAQLFRLIAGIFTGLLLILAGYYFTSLTPVGPLPEALPYLKNDSKVEVITKDYTLFKPLANTAKTGFIFYPGGRVDYRSYAPMAHSLAEKGWPVVIVPMPLNLAVFGANRASQVIKDHPEIPRWAIGGHSLGGSMAAKFVIDNPSTVTGIVFLASYPPDNKMADSTIDALSIYASNDGLIPPTMWDTYRPRFPVATRWKLIEGGNHAGFGWYGEQKGDNSTTIILQDQTDQIVQSINQFLHSIDYASK
jgi:hypothetical protein